MASRKFGPNIFLSGTLATLFFATPVGAESCRATNDNDDASCSVNCDIGERAVCRDGTGSSTPDCTCEDASASLLGRIGLHEITRNLVEPAEMNVLAVNAESTSRTLIEQDIRALVDRKLAGAGDFHLKTKCRKEIRVRNCRPGGSYPCSGGITMGVFPDDEPQSLMCFDPGGCVEEEVTICDKILGVLTLRHAPDFEGHPEVSMQPPAQNEVPVEYLTLLEDYKNCSSQQQSITFRHTERETVGWRAQTTKSVTTGRDHSVKLSVSAKYGDLFGGSVDGSISWSHEVSIGSTKETSRQKQREFDVQIPLIIPPYTNIKLSHTWIKRIVPVRYSGTATIDGGLIENKAGKKTVSDVLPDKGDRTFSFEGVVDFAVVYEGETDVDETKLTQEQCTGNDALEILVVPTRSFSSLNE